MRRQTPPPRQHGETRSSTRFPSPRASRPRILGRRPPPARRNAPPQHPHSTTHRRRRNSQQQPIRNRDWSQRPAAPSRTTPGRPPGGSRIWPPATVGTGAAHREAGSRNGEGDLRRHAGTRLGEAAAAPGRGVFGAISNGVGGGGRRKGKGKGGVGNGIVGSCGRSGGRRPCRSYAEWSGVEWRDGREREKGGGACCLLLLVPVLWCSH
nr:unnamed protein product [Digitaria exilis]